MSNVRERHFTDSVWVDLEFLEGLLEQQHQNVCAFVVVFKCGHYACVDL